MSRQLRPYQQRMVDDSIRNVVKNKWVLCQSPTGSGKSFIMNNIIQRGLAGGYTFLILSESKSIFRQLANEFNAVRIQADTKYLAVLTARCYVAMVQTIANRQRIIEQFQSIPNLILITDEAHISTANKVINLFSGMRIGFTATPLYKLSSWLPDMYKYFIEGPQVGELQQEKFLCTYRHIGRKKIDAKDLRKSSMGDFTEKSQESAFGKSKVFDGLYEDLHVIPYTKGMIYCASIKQCEDVSEKLHAHGFNNVTFHSKNGNSESNLSTFMQPDSGVNLCVSVGALTKGFDFPRIDLIVLFRATLSLALYLQMIGRGGRVIKGSKYFFTCLDYGLNRDRFGDWDQDRPWSELWLPPKNKSKLEMPAPMKQCPVCDSFVHLSAMVCKWCEFEFPQQEKTMEIGELIDFTAEYRALIGRRLSTLSATELATYAKTKNRSSAAIRVAKSNEQKQHGYLVQFGRAMGYKPRWAYMQRDLVGQEKIEYQDLIII